MSISARDQLQDPTSNHPLAVLEPEFLSQGDTLYPPENSSSPIVVFEDNVYVNDPWKNRLLTYSLIERSWNANITFPTLPADLPEERNNNMVYITATSSALVLVGTVTFNHGWTLLNKVWIREDGDWKSRDDIISSLPIEHDVIPMDCDVTPVIQSAAGYGNLLFCMYTHKTKLMVVCYDFNSNQWNGPYPGPPVTIESGLRINLAVNGSELYAQVYSHSPNHANFYASKYTDATLVWEKLTPFQKFSIHDMPRMAIVKNRLFVADRKYGSRNFLNLYTPFTNANSVRSLVDVDGSEKCNFESPLLGATGLPDGSLLVMGKVRESNSLVAKSSVIKFSSKAACYDPNKHFTLRAMKRLERVADVQVVTNPKLEGKLGSIKTFAGFDIRHCSDNDSSCPVIQYMSSWLMEYERKPSTVKPPTWSNFLESLRLVGLGDLKKEVEECLERAPKVEQTKPKEDTGVEKLQALTVMLKELHTQLKKKEEIDTTQAIFEAYRDCCDALAKIKDERIASRAEVERLTSEIEERSKALERLTEKNSSLRVRKINESTATAGPSPGHGPLPPCNNREDEKPELHELQCLKGNGKEVRVIDNIASEWKKVARALKFSEAKIWQIAKKEEEEACIEMLRCWLSGLKGCRTPISWKTLLSAIEEGTGEDGLAKEVRKCF